MKKLWVTEAGICYNAETGEYSDSNTGKVYDATKMEWINPKKPEKEPKREKEGLIITKKKRKKEAEWFQVITNFSKTFLIFFFKFFNFFFVFFFCNSILVFFSRVFENFSRIFF